MLFRWIAIISMSWFLGEAHEDLFPPRDCVSPGLQFGFQAGMNLDGSRYFLRRGDNVLWSFPVTVDPRCALPTQIKIPTLLHPFNPPGIKYRHGQFWGSRNGQLWRWDPEIKDWCSYPKIPFGFRDFEPLDDGRALFLNTIQKDSDEKRWTRSIVTLADVDGTRARNLLDLPNFPAEIPEDWQNRVSEYIGRSFENYVLIYNPILGDLRLFDALEGTLRQPTVPWTRLAPENLVKALKDKENRVPITWTDPDGNQVKSWCFKSPAPRRMQILPGRAGNITFVYLSSPVKEKEDLVLPESYEVRTMSLATREWTGSKFTSIHPPPFWSLDEDLILPLSDPRVGLTRAEVRSPSQGKKSPDSKTSRSGKPE